jgi:hypothetical protein
MFDGVKHSFICGSEQCFLSLFHYCFLRERNVSSGNMTKTSNINDDNPNYYVNYSNLFNLKKNR